MQYERRQNFLQWLKMVFEFKAMGVNISAVYNNKKHLPPIQNTCDEPEFIPQFKKKIKK